MLYFYPIWHILAAWLGQQVSHVTVVICMHTCSANTSSFTFMAWQSGSLRVMTNRYRRCPHVYGPDGADDPLSAILSVCPLSPTRTLGHEVVLFLMEPLTTTWCGYTWTWGQLFFLLWCCQGFCQMEKISLKTFQPVASEMRIPPSIHSSLSKSKEETSVCGTANGFQTLSIGSTGLFSLLMNTWKMKKIPTRKLCSKTSNTSWWLQRFPRTWPA